MIKWFGFLNGACCWRAWCNQFQCFHKEDRGAEGAIFQSTNLILDFFPYEDAWNFKHRNPFHFFFQIVETSLWLHWTAKYTFLLIQKTFAECQLYSENFTWFCVTDVRGGIQIVKSEWCNRRRDNLGGSEGNKMGFILGTELIN